MYLKKFDEVFYRYQDTAYSLGTTELGDPVPGYNLQVDLHTYPVVKHTPKGTWIEHCFGRKFVLRGARRKYAHPTKEEALESFRARKRSQIRILRNKLERAERALRIADERSNTVGHNLLTN